MHHKKPIRIFLRSAILMVILLGALFAYISYQTTVDEIRDQEEVLYIDNIETTQE